MRLKGETRRTWSACGLPLTLAALVTTASAHDPGDPQLNTLEGVVVTKKEGKPVAGATVAMAHSEKGFIFVGDAGQLSVYGPEEKVLFFLSKRNGKTACEATTDEQGRFTLKSFASLSAKYSIVVGSQKAGLAILEHICPNDYANQALRIEVDEPAYFKIPKLPTPTDSELMSYVDIALEPEPPAVKSDAEADKGENADAATRRTNIYLGLIVSTSGTEDESRVGPLAGGRKYRVGQRAWSKRFGSAATLFETVVAAEAGKTLPVKIEREGGTTLTGRVTTKEGSALRDVNVMVRAGAGSELVLGALTDEKGNYTIAHAPAGAHQLELLRYAVRVGPG
jgi:hypothetical protein